MKLIEAQKMLGVRPDGQWGLQTANALATQMKRDRDYSRFAALKLGRYFTLNEMLFSQTAVRRNIPNLPEGIHILAFVNLVENVLDPLRAHYRKPVNITSGYRSLALNRAIKGSTSSQHSHGEAADLNINGVSVKEVCTFIRDNLEYDQLIFEFARWTHVSYRQNRLRKDWKSAVKRKSMGMLRTVYIPGKFTT